jgi:hypothetical protein
MHTAGIDARYMINVPAKVTDLGSVQVSHQGVAPKGGAVAYRHSERAANSSSAYLYGPAFTTGETTAWCAARSDYEPVKNNANFTQIDT